MEQNWLDILTTTLPFIMVISIWILIMQRVKKANKNTIASYEDKHKEMTGLLREIRDELKELNKNNSPKP